MNTMLTIAKREFRSYFDSPLAYVVICLGLLMLGIWVFMGPGHFWQVDRASLAGLFEVLPAGLVLLVIPVITMRLLAEEKRMGTLEMLITLPVRDSDVILGKYLGALGLVLTLVASTALYPVLMFKNFGLGWSLGPLDAGPVWSSYIGLLLFSAATVAIGLLISSVTDSQVIAFFVSLVVLALLYFVGELGALAPGAFGETLHWISFRDHFMSFQRGLIDARDVVFFLSCAALALMLSFRSLESRKWT